MVQPADIRQSDYHPTEYSDSSWELVGERQSTEDFVPLGVEVVSQSENVVDPMFDNFGGLSPQTGPKRWHLPTHLAHKTPQDEARELVDEKRQSFSEEELGLLRQEVLQSGIKTGREEAEKHHKTEREHWERRVTDLFKDLNTQLEERLQALERKAVELAVAIGRKIIDGAVEINPEYILKVVSDALALSGGASILRVRISPQDMEFMEVIGAARQLKEYDGSWKFEVDDTIKAGCVVETSAGEIDYQLDSAWERVRENVIKVLR